MSRTLETVSRTLFHPVCSALLQFLRFLLLWARVVICNFDPDLPGVFALAAQRVPNIVLSSTWNNNLLQIDPRFSNYLSLFVIVENRNFQLVIVWGVVDRKSKLLVPANRVSIWLFTQQIFQLLTILEFALLGDLYRSSLLPCQASPRNTGPACQLSSYLADSSRDQQ